MLEVSPTSTQASSDLNSKTSTLDQLFTPEASKTVSYSRLSCYIECPTKYKYRYVVKPADVHIPLENYFLKGTLAHRCIEEYLKGAEKENAIEVVLPQWLEENCLIPVGRDYDEICRATGIDARTVCHYAKTYGVLLHKCSSVYRKNDAIRNRDGSVPKDPLEYPPTQLKNDYKNKGLDEVKLSIDNSAAMLNPEFRRFSLADTAASAIACVYNFSLPDWVDEVTGIEYTSEEKIAWDDGNKEWAWFIDLMYKTSEGGTVISDHKTGKEKPEGLDVAFHPQLNLYAYLVYETTGKFPEYLAINHLPTGEFVIAKTDPAIVKANYEKYSEVQKAVNLSAKYNNYLKHSPTDYNSPCIKRDWKTKSIKSVCPYLELCHPRYVEYTRTELKDILHL